MLFELGPLESDGLSVAYIGVHLANCRCKIVLAFVVGCRRGNGSIRIVLLVCFCGSGLVALVVHAVSFESVTHLSQIVFCCLLIDAKRLQVIENRGKIPLRNIHEQLLSGKSTIIVVEFIRVHSGRFDLPVGNVIVDVSPATQKHSVKNMIERRFVDVSFLGYLSGVAKSCRRLLLINFA